MAYTGPYPPETEEQIKAYMTGSTDDPVEQSAPPVICPFCGKGVKQDTFGYEEEEGQWFYIRSVDYPDPVVGGMQRWVCIKDTTHVFFHSNEK